MFSVESSFALKYFVFGFKNLEKTKVVIGYYHKNKKIFVVDFHGEFTKQVKDDFVNGKIKLPYVNILGVGFESFKDIIEKQYIRDKSFSVDYMSYENEFMNVNNKLVAKSSESVSLQVGLSDGLRWNTGRLYEHCDVSFSYDDYFDDIVVEFKPFKNVEVVSYRDVQGIAEKIKDTSDAKKEVSKEVVLGDSESDVKVEEKVESTGGVTKVKEEKEAKGIEEDLDFDISYFSSSIKSTENVEDSKDSTEDEAVVPTEKAVVDVEKKEEEPKVPKEEKGNDIHKTNEGFFDVTNLVETSKVVKQEEKVVPKEEAQKKPKADNPVFEENDFSFGLFDWDDVSDDDSEASKEVKEEKKGTDDFELPDFNFSFDD